MLTRIAITVCLLIVVGFFITSFDFFPDVQHNLQPCLTGHQYGFWYGLWHGVVILFSFVGSLFSNNISIWGVNNNGGWYTFGFMLGITGAWRGFLWLVSSIIGFIKYNL